jgi:GT2 family glycosyltransferase
MIYVQVIVLELGWLRAEQRDFMVMLSRDDRYGLIMGRNNAKPVTNNRNQIVKKFLDSPHDFLLMMDNDVVPRNNPLDYIENDLDIVVFPCPIWRPAQGSESPVVWNIRMEDEKGDRIVGRIPASGLREISEGGTGAMLIARRVLEAVHAPFVEEMDEYGVSTLGHDLAFCARAREAGFKVWAALDCPCRHWDTLDLSVVDSIFKENSNGLV